MMKVLARCAFVLVTVLWGSFYAAAKGALVHNDPIIFTFFEALTLVPIALVLLVLHRKRLTRAIFTRGLLLGSCLCIATLTITVSENFTSATTTAFFPSLGGIFAAVIMATVFRRALGTSVWIACGLSCVGMLLIFRGSLSGTELRGEVLALIGALLFTVYLFLVDQDAQHQEQPFWALLGVEHLSLALWMSLFALLFGDWHHFHPVLTHDIPVVLYVALACTFLPVILTHFAHRFLDPLETGFISILEPLWGILIAHLALGEVVPLPMYVGGGLILTGAIIHQAATEEVLAFSRSLTFLLCQRMSNAITSVTIWFQSWLMALLTVWDTSLLAMIRWSILRENGPHPGQADHIGKAPVLALPHFLQSWLTAYSHARIHFRSAFSYHLSLADSLLRTWSSLLPLSFIPMLRSIITDVCTLFEPFGRTTWKHWRGNAYYHWPQYLAHGSLPSDCSSLYGEFRRHQRSSRRVQERRVSFTLFPQHALGHLTGVWCTAPPDTLEEHQHTRSGWLPWL